MILPENDLITLQMIDTEGRLVMEKGFRNMPKGLNLINQDLQAYSEGTYVVNIVVEGEVESVRIMKQ